MPHSESLTPRTPKSPKFQNHNSQNSCVIKSIGTNVSDFKSIISKILKSETFQNQYLWNFWFVTHNPKISDYMLETCNQGTIDSDAGDGWRLSGILVLHALLLCTFHQIVKQIPGTEPWCLVHKILIPCVPRLNINKTDLFLSFLYFLLVFFFIFDFLSNT